MRKNKTLTKLLLLVGLMLCTTSMLSARVLYVSATDGSDANDGGKDAPYATISKAARLAIACDTVMIHAGTYREWVSPANGGISKERNITYMPFEGEEVVIKGSEVIGYWKKEKSGVWSTKVDNKIFGEFNPFDIHIVGDWLNNPDIYHLGELFINDKSLQEVLTKEEVAESLGSWIAEVGDEVTTITASFEGNPNQATTEINVRPACFFPKTTGVNYISVRGLKISQAATQWSAPTSEQVGIIGPNWSKGWVIEDCEISNSKCVGICIGKERASGHNMWSQYKGKFGYMHHGFNREIEAIFKAYDLGWSMENIGSHTIHNNYIYDCGQAGIVGHMGCINSVVSHNRIDNINVDTKLNGAETGGIKLHAAIDCIVENNYITNSRRGMWFDWQIQGTHIRGNIISGSITQDVWLEVSHGPSFFYNNVLCSSKSLLFSGAKGVACFNNLLLGCVYLFHSHERYTPYHMPHSTKIKGLGSCSHGDLKFYNNIFMDKYHEMNEDGKEKFMGGLYIFDDYPTFDEILDDTELLSGSHKGFLLFKFPIWTSDNTYFKGAMPYVNEENYQYFKDLDPEFRIVERDGDVYIESDIDTSALSRGVRVDTELLGYSMVSEATFENVDGTPFILEFDINGADRNPNKPGVGPCSGEMSQLIWSSASNPLE